MPNSAQAWSASMASVTGSAGWKSMSDQGDATGGASPMYVAAISFPRPAL